MDFDYCFLYSGGGGGTGKFIIFWYCGIDNLFECCYGVCILTRNLYIPIILESTCSRSLIDLLHQTFALLCITPTPNTKFKVKNKLIICNSF